MVTSFMNDLQSRDMAALTIIGDVMYLLVLPIRNLVDTIVRENLKIDFVGSWKKRKIELANNVFSEEKFYLIEIK